MFPHCKKNLGADGIVSKTFLLETNTFEFGPLLCGKIYNSVKVDRYLLNVVHVTIRNDSLGPVIVTFRFQQDSKPVVFHLNPTTMMLPLGQQQKLCIMAFPTTKGHFEDTVLCLMHNNPVPVTFGVSCDGVWPEVEMKDKTLTFKKTILHRKETKCLVMLNTTMLPIAWNLSGLETLGEGFSVDEDHGVMAAHSEGVLRLSLCTKRPLCLSKMLCLEISDVDDILGIVHTEKVQVIAEAYDVALDISFPKGLDGGLDFGVIHVIHQAKRHCILKNKGKHKVAFDFVLQSLPSPHIDPNSLFTVDPQQGCLKPSNPTVNVQITFHPSREVHITEESFLHCRVIEPSVHRHETVASIPIKVSAKAVHHQCRVVPACDLAFGPVPLNVQQSRFFTLTNCGHFDFTFLLNNPKQQKQSQPRQHLLSAIQKLSTVGGSRTSKVMLSKLHVQTRRPFPVDAAQDRYPQKQAYLELGVFVIYPPAGALAPGVTLTVTVDCTCNHPGAFDEVLLIAINGCDPQQYPDGIPYHVTAEACYPSISHDWASIFEEHRICKTVLAYSPSGEPATCEGGTFIEDTNQFIFDTVQVGKTSQARVKIVNPGKVTCNVTFHVKSSSSSVNAFNVEPNRSVVKSYGHVYVTVTFAPETVQSYQAFFEATVEGQSTISERNSNLTFEITGEGTLPHLTILRPLLKDQSGWPLFLFPRLLHGRVTSLPLVLANNGLLPAKVNLDLTDKTGAFKLEPHPERTNALRASSGHDTSIEQTWEDDDRVHLVLPPGERSSLDVTFTAVAAQSRCEAFMLLCVEDNSYQNMVLQVIGETYEEMVTLENLPPLPPETKIQSLSSEATRLEVPKEEHLHFGDCHVGQAYTRNFTLTNHSSCESVRFEWISPLTCLKFSPQMGHLLAGLSKDILVTLRSQEPMTLTNHSTRCLLWHISFPDGAPPHPGGWDSRQHRVRWLDVETMVDEEETAPTKTKVTEMEVEPDDVRPSEQPFELSVCLSAVVDHCRFDCSTNPLSFRDTFIFQTRVFQFELFNTGKVTLPYCWEIHYGNHQGTDESTNGSTHLDPDSRPTSRCESRGPLAQVLTVTTPLQFDSLDRCPFLVEPEHGAVAVKAKQDFKVKFFPLEQGIFECRFICRIPNLECGVGKPAFTVRGRGVLPLCHFEVTDSDYLSKGRRNASRHGPAGSTVGSSLNPATRVLEFHTVGVGHTCSKSFYMMNPTTYDYDFLWEKESDEGNGRPTSSCFHCLTETGFMKSGKKVQVTFQFAAPELGLVEDFWRFLIPDRDVVVPFLLVGWVHEPAVSFDRSFLDMSHLLVGQAACERLAIVNKQDEPFDFDFCDDLSRLTLNDPGTALNVKPSRGVVAAHSRMVVTVSLTPGCEGAKNFTLHCAVRGLQVPLKVNIKARAWAVEVALRAYQVPNNALELTADAVNRLDFGEVEVNDHAQYTVAVTNMGHVHIPFSWLCERPRQKRKSVTKAAEPEDERPPEVATFGAFSVEPACGMVLTGQQVTCTLCFHPKRAQQLHTTMLLLKVDFGPSFSCEVRGQAVVPLVSFSFENYDFGNCLQHEAGITSASTTLQISNDGKKDASVEFIPQQEDSAFIITCPCCVLEPQCHLDVLIAFQPRHVGPHRESVRFDINGTTQHIVEFSGRGTELKVEVANPKLKVVKFGVLSEGQSIRRNVPIVNKSKAAVTFTLQPELSAPDMLDSTVLALSPVTPIKLEPGETTEEPEVCFSPRGRVPAFSTRVLALFGGVLELGASRPLFSVQGCCLTTEVSLEMQQINFGAVVTRGQMTRHLVLRNTGDYGVNFKWDSKRLAPNFSISPTQGHAVANSNVMLKVTFHPRKRNADVRCSDVPCHVEGHDPLYVTLTGSCLSSIPLKEVVKFSCAVRSKQRQTIYLNNHTGHLWLLQPVIQGRYWSAPMTVSVQPKQTHQPYEITFHPLTRPDDGDRFQGSLFIALPDGSGLLYILDGAVQAPAPVCTITRDVVCQETYTETLPIENWLPKSQRFHLVIEMVKPEKLSSATKLYGVDFVDVAASGRRDFKIHFFSYKEGTFTAKVIFLNKGTQEFIFFTLMFHATAPDVVQVVELSATVRHIASTSLVLHNPLPVPVTFKTDCDVDEVNLPPEFVVPAESKASISLEYRPIHVGNADGELRFHSHHLCPINYALQLDARAAPPERTLHFKAALGCVHVQSASFLHYLSQRTEYTCKIDSPVFRVQPVVTAAGGMFTGSEFAVDVSYMPCDVGQTCTTLLITSPQGGEYVTPLIGVCTSPQPQGPYKVQAGSSVTVAFHNVFKQTTTFSLAIDNPAFTVPKKTMTIHGRQPFDTVVSYKAPTSKVQQLPGRLTVSCAGCDGAGRPFTWMFYLCGVLSHKKPGVAPAAVESEERT